MTNVTYSQVQGPVSAASTQWTPYNNADLEAEIAFFTVTVWNSNLGTTLSTASSGWTKDGQISVRTGNIQLTVERATQATFRKDGPGASETLVIDSSQSVWFAGSLLLVEPA